MGMISIHKMFILSRHLYYTATIFYTSRSLVHCCVGFDNTKFFVVEPNYCSVYPSSFLVNYTYLDFLLDFRLSGCGHSDTVEAIF